MPTSRSSGQREMGLRRQLLNKIFLQALHHEPLPEPPIQSACSLRPYNIREQPAHSEMSQQDVEMENEDISMKCGDGISSPPIDSLLTSLPSENSLQTGSYNPPDAVSNVTDSPNSVYSMAATNPVCSETNVPVVQPISIRKPHKKMSKRSSKVLARIESLERSVVMFCEKENEMPSDVLAFQNQDNSIFQNIKTSQQKKKYEKFFKKALKVCSRLEGEISLHSQYVATLEAAVGSVKKGSKLYKMLEVKLRTALKFHDENLSHEQLRTLLRQAKLVNLLINKYESETQCW